MKHGLKKKLKDGFYLHALINYFSYMRDNVISGQLIIFKKDSSWEKKIDKETHPKDENGNYIENFEIANELKFEIRIPDNSQFSSKELSKKDNNIMKQIYIWCKENMDILDGWGDYEVK